MVCQGLTLAALLGSNPGLWLAPGMSPPCPALAPSHRNHQDQGGYHGTEAGTPLAQVAPRGPGCAPGHGTRTGFASKLWWAEGALCVVPSMDPDLEGRGELRGREEMLPQTWQGAGLDLQLRGPRGQHLESRTPVGQRGQTHIHHPRPLLTLQPVSQHLRGCPRA